MTHTEKTTGGHLSPAKKILAITAIRSDYDLMSGLYRLLDKDPDTDLQLLVAGAHLSAAYGNSVGLIKKDGFTILMEIESLISADSPKSRLKSASILLQNAIDVVARWQPELIIYAGDREDVLIGGLLGAFLAIPTVHFFGGDHSKDGHTDTVIRHATSKLSTFHVVSAEQHKQRLIKLGEAPERIAVTGSIALDKFIEASHAPAQDIHSIAPQGKQLDQYAMLIFHPVDQEKQQAAAIFEAILLTLKKSGIPAIVSYPNTDPGNHLIIEKIKQYEHAPHFWFYTNLERSTFLSLYRQARFLIGNSSSGILEAASIPLAVINVGLRQKGRYCEGNVLFCETGADAIEAAITQAISPEFQSSVKKINNPYGAGNSCTQAFTVLKTTDFAGMLKKTEDPLDL